MSPASRLIFLSPNAARIWKSHAVVGAFHLAERQSPKVSFRLNRSKPRGGGFSAHWPMHQSNSALPKYGGVGRTLRVRDAQREIEI
jgi:hypothetical protein